MSRFNRVNIDGKSITETAVSAAALKPGTPVNMVAGKFVSATAVKGRIYIVNPAYHEGLGIEDAIPAGDSVVADYAEGGREFAILVPAGTYAKDAGITIGADGFDLAVTDDPVFAYCQEDIILAEGDFIRVRVA